MSSSKVNRIIDVAEEKDWIERPKSRTPDAKKHLQMTAKGRHVIAEFERLSREAVGAKSRPAPLETTEDAAPGTRLQRAKGRPRPSRSETFDFEEYERRQSAAK